MRILPQNPSSLPAALLVASVETRTSPGWVGFGSIPVLNGVKVATVFEDPSIQASDTKIYCSFTRELAIFGTGFSNVVRPYLVFQPPLDAAAVDLHVSRTWLYL